MCPIKSHNVLIVVGEESTRSSLDLLLQSGYTTLIANTGQIGLEMLRRNKVHVVLVDHGLSDMSGVGFLEIVKARSPDTIRILLASEIDLASVIAAINTGRIFRLFLRPYNPAEVVKALQEAAHYYDDNARKCIQTRELIDSKEMLERRVQGQTAALDRKNILISALNRLSVKLQSTLEIENIIQTLDSELKNLRLQSLVLSFPIPKGKETITYVSPSILLAVRTQGWEDSDIVEFLTGQNPNGFGEILEKRTPIFIDDLHSAVAHLLDGLSPPAIDRFIRTSGITSDAHGIFLPMLYQDQLVGLLGLWGEDLQEADMSAVTIFASQLAITIENARLFNQVQQLAITDDLTGTYNRRHFLNLALREFIRARRLGHPLALLMIDVDYFKQINDSFSHIVGDKVLKVLTTRWQGLLRESIDVLGRYGGDEFAIILPETDLERAISIADRLRLAAENDMIETPHEDIEVTISIGVTTLGDDNCDFETLMFRADQALYAAKRAGRRRTAVWQV
jgi:diguanylate cyclase (GGDEF)-like protein